MFPSMDVWYMIDIIRYIAIQNMKYKTLIVNFTQQVVRSAEWALRRFSPRLLQSRRSSASRFSLGSRSLQIDIFVLLSQHQDCIWIKHIQFIYEYNTFISSKDILLRRTVSRFFFYVTMMYADMDGFLDLQTQIISRWTSRWWTTVPTWLASSGWTALGSAPLTSPWRRWAGRNIEARIS